MSRGWIAFGSAPVEVVTPPHLSNAGASFGWRPAGTYRVDFTGTGGLYYFPTAGNRWSVNHIYNATLDRIVGFYVATGSGAEILTPGLQYSAAITPNVQPPSAAGAPFGHPGGEIRIVCRDTVYTDNVPSPWGAPQFRLVRVG